MKNLMTQYSQLEQDLVALHSGTSQSREMFTQSVMSILKAPAVSSYIKSDRIAEAFIELDAKIAYIKEQQKLLASLKKQLDLAKAYGKEEVAKALESLGVTKIEGVTVSSITTTKATDKSVAKLEVYDENALMNLGYFSVTLDKEAVEKALLSADQRHEVEEFADMTIEVVHKPATIRINKRKVVPQEDVVEQRASSLPSVAA